MSFQVPVTQTIQLMTVEHRVLTTVAAGWQKKLTMRLQILLGLNINESHRHHASVTFNAHSTHRNSGPGLNGEQRTW